MPQKTKKQKLLTELHRQRQIIKMLRQDDLKLHLSIINQPIPKKKELEVKQPIFSSKIKIKTVTIDHSWVYADLKRIAIISLLAFSLEVVVYWALTAK